MSPSETMPLRLGQAREARVDAAGAVSFGARPFCEKLCEKSNLELRGARSCEELSEAGPRRPWRPKTVAIGGLQEPELLPEELGGVPALPLAAAELRRGPHHGLLGGGAALRRRGGRGGAL